MNHQTRKETMYVHAFDFVNESSVQDFCLLLRNLHSADCVYTRDIDGNTRELNLRYIVSYFIYDQS